MDIIDKFLPRELIVDGQSLEDLLDSPADSWCAANRALKILQTNDNIDINNVLDIFEDSDIKENINRFNDFGNANDIEEFCGVSGFALFHFLKVCQNRLRDENDDYHLKVEGQIVEYNYDNTTKSGTLVVNMNFRTFLSEQSLINCKPDCEDLFTWHICINNWRLHKRIDEGFPQFPFPKLQGIPNFNEASTPSELPKIKFPPHAVDPNDSRSIWCRCLKYKLYAEGDGIKIKKIIHTPTKFGKQLDDYPIEDHCWCETTSGSCVDLLMAPYTGENFEREPRTIEELQSNDYCLGRCEDPPIANTGGGT